MKGAKIPASIKSDEKIKLVTVKSRPTFREMVDYANEHILRKTAVIANLDIFFSADSDWYEAEKLLVENERMVLALSRHEFESRSNIFLDPTLGKIFYANAQDAWLFKTPLKVDNVDFEVGTLGADNAFADRLVKGGYIPVNLASRYQIYHFDVCRGKNGANAVEVHYRDSVEQNSLYSRFPEKSGLYFVPDFDKCNSVDHFLNAIGVDSVSKYRIICDLLSSIMKVNNEVGGLS